MDIRTMQVFCKVYETKNFTKASKELFVSQQALSKQISKLEKDYGKDVFLRKSSGTEPTPFGDFLYEECKSVLRAYQQMNNHVDNFLSNNPKSIRVAVERGLISSPSLMENIVKDFQKLFGAEINFVSHDGDTCRQLVQAKEVDAALITAPDNSGLEEFTLVPVAEIDMFVSFLPGLEPTDSEESSALTLKEQLESFVYLGANSLIKQWVTAMFAEEGLAGAPSFKVYEDAGMYLLGYMKSFNLAILHWKSLLFHLNDPDLITLPLTNFKMQLSVISNSDETSKTEALEFFQVIHKYAKNI